MELIVISEKKLKIMLTAPEMAHYELETASLDCADVHTRAAFRHIFDDARDRIGFDTDGERLFIQFYASREGGCEIFVTKLGDTGLSFTACEAAVESSYTADASSLLAVASEAMTEGERELLNSVYAYGEENDFMEASYTEQRVASAGVRVVALILERTQDILTVCHRLLREGYRSRSTAYIEERSGESLWYLLLDIPDVPLYRLPRRFAFLLEYGRETEAVGLFPYLSEYGRCIREGDAVEVLGQL